MHTSSRRSSFACLFAFLSFLKTSERFIAFAMLRSGAILDVFLADFNEKSECREHDDQFEGHDTTCRRGCR